MLENLKDKYLNIMRDAKKLPPKLSNAVSSPLKKSMMISTLGHGGLY